MLFESIMYFILALIPIILILSLMIGFRWGAARSGGAGYLCTLAIAIASFGAGPELLAVAHAKALLLTIDVLLIIWGAFLLYRVVDEAGAIKIIGNALPFLTSERGLQAAIIGWVFASFLQGVGGFGVPVAVIAPILIGLGFSPLVSVVVPSIGHGWAVTFGSLGSSFNALLATTGLPQEVLGPPAAIFLGFACLLTGFMVVQAAAGTGELIKLAVPIILTGMVMAVVQYLVVRAGAWNLGAFIASLAGILILFPIAYKKNKKHRGKAGKLNIPSLIIALSGYIILIIVTLVVQLNPPIRNWLSQVKITTEFPQVSTSLGFEVPPEPGRALNIFGHTGVLLIYSSIFAYGIYLLAGLYRSGAPRRILSGTLAKVMASSVSIASMVAMAVIMEHSGMTDALARGLAEGTGQGFPFISPWIGALGAFITGSNTNSNVIFGSLQMRTAELLGYSVAIILGAQTAGAAVASVLAPTKVVVGASTAGMAGKEGEVMRSLFIYTFILVLLISLLAGIGIWLSS